MVSSLGHGTEWGGGVMFWVAKIKRKNMGAWNSWYFLGWVVDAGPDPTYEEKVTPPPPPPGANPFPQGRYFA